MGRRLAQQALRDDGSEIDVDKRRSKSLAADVFIENNRPGALDRLGFGYDRLSKIESKALVLVSISGFGQKGPDALRPGFGKIAEAMSGQVAVTGRPDATPYHIGFSLADTSSGLSGVFAIALILYLRDVEKRERGAYVDIALFEPLLRMQECQFALREKIGAPMRQGSNDPYSWGVASEVAIACHVCADGAWLAIMTRPPSPKAPADLGAFVAARPADAALAELAELGVEAVRVHDGLSLAQSAYFRERGDVQQYRHSALGELTVPGVPPRVYGARSAMFSARPLSARTNWLQAWLRNDIPRRQAPLFHRREQSLRRRGARHRAARSFAHTTSSLTRPMPADVSNPQSVAARHAARRPPRPPARCGRRRPRVLDEVVSVSMTPAISS